MAEPDPWEEAQTYAWEQEVRRGEWPSQRSIKMPAPPWPDPDNPMLEALLSDARKNLETLGVEAALIQLATHCWFEGGIEGYDRGQVDARAEGPRKD